MKRLPSIFIALLLGLLAVPAFSQTAQITGRVTDSSSAVMPDAQVSVTNLSTGITRNATTNGEGYYTVPLLPRGEYQVTVQRASFKPLSRKGLNLDEGQNLRLDFTLEPGEVRETVQITGAGPLLESANATMSTVIGNRKIVELPLLNRNVITLAALTPTVRPVGAFGGLPVSSFDGARMSISGGNSASNNLMVDGIAAENFASGGLNIFLSVDATEEFRVVTRNPSAEYGRTGGGVVSIVSKSGANEFHGSLYEFARNRSFNANSFFGNRAGRAKPQFTLNQYGGVIGGPLWLPKKGFGPLSYDGHNKTFFFFNYEGFKLRETTQAIRTVPTALQRQGDFRGTFDAQGRQVMIYDPATTRSNGSGGFIRDVVSCNGVQNVICANRIHPVAAAVLKFYPLPNQAGTIAGANNFFGQASQPQDKTIYGIKIDHNLTPNRRISGRYTYDKTFRGDPNIYGTIGETNTSALDFIRNSIAINYTDALSPTLALEARAGINRYFTPRDTRSLGIDLTTLGFAGALNNQVRLRQFPRFNISDFSAIGADQGDVLRQGNNALTTGAGFTKTLATQTLKFGYEQRVYQSNNSQAGSPIAQFDFNRGFSQGPTPNTTGTNIGFGLANFLLGAVSGGTASRFSAPAVTVKHFALYVQDDWKLTPKLTLNLGLRWEYEGALTDRFNQLSNFDPNLKAQVGNVPVTGGLVYPGVNGLARGNRDNRYREFGPRFGFAYQLFSKTVLRGGYGLYYLPSTGGFTSLPRTGFDLSTPLIAANAAVNGGFSPVANLSDPFPNGLLQPVRNTGGPTTGVGTGVGGNVRNLLERGYSQQANFNVQHELPGSFLIELGYAMNRGVSVPANRTFDYLPFAVRQRFTVAELQQAVPNPFFGAITTGTLSNANVQRQNLLDTYPQYQGVSGLDSWGASNYHAMTARVERRFSQGLSLSLAYTWSKLIDNVLGGGGNSFADGGNESVQDWDNLRAERAISSNDLPHRLVVSAIYNLPFGKEGHPAYRAVIGGWQLTGIMTLQSGNPIGVTVGAGGRPFAGSRPHLIGNPDPGSSRSIDNWFNRAAFDYPAERTPGTAPRNLPSYRTDGYQNLDLSLLKNFAFTEKVRMQFRAEAFNFTNTPTFGGPAAGFGNANFGTITGVQGSARQVQLGLKLYF
jgi:hypothetical protein